MRSAVWGKTGVRDWGLGVRELRSAEYGVRSQNSGVRIQNKRQGLGIGSYGLGNDGFWSGERQGLGQLPNGDCSRVILTYT